MYDSILLGECTDYTASYLLILDKDYTVKEFIDTILNKKDRWHGTFYIFIGYENINEFGEPKYKYKCEYEYYGKLTGNLPPDDILNKKLNQSHHMVVVV